MSSLGLLNKIGVFFLAFLFPLSALALSFSDVPNYHKHYQAVSSLSDSGVINGYSDGSFKPDNTITRAEAVKLLIADIKSSSEINQVTYDMWDKGWIYASFFDVPVSEWYAPYVALAYSYGIVSGYPDGTFKPSNTINFAEGLKMILETYEIDAWRVRYKYNPLLYISSDDWFASYFTYAYNKNLINRDKFYHPAQKMTRGEFAEILYRLKYIQENGMDEFPSISTSYSDEYTITIPRLNIINLKVSFADLYSSQHALEKLKGGMGHYLSPPGNGKKMVLFGHSSGYSWDHSAYKQVLRQINKLGIGDMIYINYQEKGYVYQISNTEVLPAGKLNVILTDYGYEEMALYTCWPPDSIKYRYVVYAGSVL